MQEYDRGSKSLLAQFLRDKNVKHEIAIATITKTSLLS
jgi:hypothetical protein